eukprot:5595085-Pleurochrysis_carterae.AAC.1
MRKRSLLTAVHETAVEVVRERARKVKELEKENEILREEKQRAEERWSMRLESEVRTHVRQARRDLHTCIFAEIAQLKEGI